MRGWKTCHRPRYRLGISMCMFGLLWCAFRARASEASYISFQVPGALGTYPMSINNSMVVTGYYYASSTLVRGFVRAADGAITTFEVAGSGWTVPESINDAGEIVGFYESDLGIIPDGFSSQSFLRSADGQITVFNPPCGECEYRPPESMYLPTQPYSINAFGEVVGAYLEPETFGFRRLKNGSFVTYEDQFVEPNLSGPLGVVATAINASGTVTGIYGEPSNPGTQSFIEDAHGYLTLGISVPSPGTNKPFTGVESTVAEGINAGGTIVGWYAGCDGVCGYPPVFLLTVGGFLRSPQGELTLFNPPGALVTSPGPGFKYQIDYPNFPPGSLSYLQSGSYASAPHPLSINEAGSVIGSYTDTAGAQHGFVRNPYGTVTSFDPPRGHQTTATGLNDDGVVTGTYLYVGTNPTAIGFLRIPEP